MFWLCSPTAIESDTPTMKARCRLSPSRKTLRVPSTKNSPMMIRSRAPVTGTGTVWRTATIFGSRASTTTIAPMTTAARRAATPVKSIREIVVGR